MAPPFLLSWACVGAPDRGGWRACGGIGGLGVTRSRESLSRSRNPPCLTCVAAVSPSWLTPSACSWSTQTQSMRRRSTPWGTVMAPSLCSDFGPTPADLVPSAGVLAACCSPLMPSASWSRGLSFPKPSEYSLALQIGQERGLLGPLCAVTGRLLPLGLAYTLCKPYPCGFLRLFSVPPDPPHLE